jgi:hypothetical protein
MLSSSQKIIDLAMYGSGVNSQNAPDLVKFLTDIEELNYDTKSRKQTALDGLVG